MVDLLPDQRPEHRADINQRYVSLGPADVDIGFAGRHRPEDQLHARIARLSPGDTVVVSGGQVKTKDGQVIGRLASKTDLRTKAAVSATVSGVLVRTREQTAAEYRASVKVDQWETVLMELILPAD